MADLICTLSPSVIIPTCNRNHLLGRALLSVKSALDSVQFTPGVGPEIIVVDDGHCDETASNVQSFAARCPYDVRYLRSGAGARSGPAAARDFGVKASQGDVIFLLDDDDEFLENRFQHCLPIYHDKSVDAVLETSIRGYSADRARTRDFLTGPYGSIDDAFLFMMNSPVRGHITPGATSVRKEAYKKVGGYDTSLRFGEDAEFLLRLSLLTRVVMLETPPVTRIWIHESNTSAPQSLDYYQNVKAIAALRRNCLAHVSPAQLDKIETALRGKFDYAMFSICMERDRASIRLQRIYRCWSAFPLGLLTWRSVKAVWLALLPFLRKRRRTQS